MRTQFERCEPREDDQHRMMVLGLQPLVSLKFALGLGAAHTCPMTRLLLAVNSLVALLLPPAPTVADARFARLSEPGVVAIMRHADAPATGDSASFALNDCATQRNLGARGREQAPEIGAAIRAADVGVDRVLTSQ